MPSRTPNTQLRSLMADRGKMTESPKWKSATDVFKSPKSPSPLQRRSKRLSIYQRKPAKSDITKAKAIASPPGVKTRARRSSIYQKGGGRLLSPSNLPVRTRRTSLYVPSKRNLQSINEFSKVWATPVKLDVKVILSPAEKEMNIAPSLKDVSSLTRSGKRSANKQKVDKDLDNNQESDQSTMSSNKPASPKSMPKTPASMKKMAKKAIITSDASPGLSLSDQVILKRSTRQNQKIAEESIIAVSKPQTPKHLPKTPCSVKRTPKDPPNTKMSSSEHIAAKRSARLVWKEIDEKCETPENKLTTPENEQKTKTKPKTSKTKLEKPEMKQKTPGSKAKTPLVTNSVAKSSKRPPLSIKVTLRQGAEALNNLEPQKESTPVSSKISRGKSFYSTPKATPLNEPIEDLIQLSTGANRSSNKRKRVSVVLTPRSSPKKDSIKKQYRKTPKPPKRQMDDSLYSTPVSTTKKARVAELDWTEQPIIKDNTNKQLLSKVRLSPEEMSSVLRSAEQEERERERRLSVSIAKHGENSPSQTTPLFSQKGKKISSKKLSEVVDKNVSGLSATSLNSSVELNNTIYSDSRSSRCIIL